MLKTILSISGKPGLYKIVSQGKNMIIVESLITGKRGPAYAHEKIISLSDIAIFTEEGEKPLFEVLEAIKTKENGQKVSIDIKDTKVLKEYLAEVLPDFDRDRVYPADIKKLLTWYNLLIETGNADFTADDKEEKNEDAEKA